jgi:hypothetical protein
MARPCRHAVSSVPAVEIILPAWPATPILHQQRFQAHARIFKQIHNPVNYFTNFLLPEHIGKPPA